MGLILDTSALIALERVRPGSSTAAVTLDPDELWAAA